MTFGVRLHFEWQGENVWEIVGPFGDRWAADCYLLSLAEGWTFGITRVQVQRAIVVPWAS